MQTTKDRATKWSVTINNPTDADEEDVNRARQKGWQVIGQREVGANGTPHYQLMVKTPQVRFAQMKKAFPRGHIEVARNEQALEQYVSKEETRVGELPQQQVLYPSLSKLWDLIYEEFNLGHNKLGWDQTQDEVQFYREEDNDHYLTDPLVLFDEVIGRLIRRGYHVETMAVNPQIRACFKKFSSAILFRSRSQTDRQTDNASESEQVSLATTT